ncbi:MAG: hypothetical protein J5I93_15035 [Pirellulaceae bacterium]|nr:hypothetical protein [Pirellulaceae bacterium]
MSDVDDQWSGSPPSDEGPGLPTPAEHFDRPREDDWDQELDELILGGDDSEDEVQAPASPMSGGDLDAMLRRLDALSGLVATDSAPDAASTRAATNELPGFLGKTLHRMSSSLTVALLAVSVSTVLLVLSGSSHSTTYLAGATAAVLGMFWTTRFLFQARQFERALEAVEM